MVKQKKRSRRKKSSKATLSHQYRFSFVCFVRRFSLRFFFIHFPFIRFLLLSISSSDCSYPIEMFILEGKKAPERNSGTRERQAQWKTNIYTNFLLLCVRSFVFSLSPAISISMHHWHIIATCRDERSGCNVDSTPHNVLLLGAHSLTAHITTFIDTVVVRFRRSGHVIQANDENKFFRVVEYWEISRKTFCM